MHGSLGQGVQGRLPVFTFHEGIFSTTSCPSNHHILTSSTRAPVPLFQLCLISPPVCTNKPEVLRLQSRIRKSRVFFLFFFRCNASHKMIYPYLIFVLWPISRSYDSRKSATHGRRAILRRHQGRRFLSCFGHFSLRQLLGKGTFV